MIDYSLFKPIDSFDPAIRLLIYEEAIVILKHLPKGCFGLCGAMQAACCRISYQGELSIIDSTCVEATRVYKMFKSPYYHMRVYRELNKYKPNDVINTHWWPLKDRATRLTKLRQAIRCISKKIPNENQNNNG